MITKIEQLSIGQLAKVFNAVTGQTVSKFANKKVGRARVAKALEKHLTDLPSALAMAGLADPVEALETKRNGEPKAPEPLPEPPAYPSLAGDYSLTTDKWGFKHRNPVDRKRSGSRMRAIAKELDETERSTAAANRGAEKYLAKASAKPRDGSKGEVVLQLLTKGGGATIADIMTETGWLPHTTRAYLSRLGKTMAIKSEKIERNGQKLRVYSAQA
jgi:Protein of unknown function (DUF3489)